MKRFTLISAAAALAISATAAMAQSTPQGQQPPAKKSQAREQIYGSQLMTPQERTEYRDRMRAAKTQQERDQIRTEHHTQMQARAKERGVTLPDAPRARSGAKGTGPGAGPGKGMGMGPARGGAGPGPGGGGPGAGYGPGTGGGPAGGPGGR